MGPVQQLILRQLVHNLHQYGKDPEGNIVISQGSLEEVAEKIADIVHKAVERPVVTTTISDVQRLASRAGFILQETQSAGVTLTRIKDRTGAVTLDDEVQRLVDYTTQLVLERVTLSTKVKE